MEKVDNDPDILTDIQEIYSYKWKWSEYFWNENPLVLEIGTGMGNFFGKLVSEHPDKNFIGIEIRYKRLFQTAEKARRAMQFALSPLGGKLDRGSFVMIKDFGQNIDQIFSEGEISESYIFFPDPWGKKERQRKHRIMQELFLEKLYNITKKWGKVFFKTDHREYFDTSFEIIKTQWLWKIEQKIHDYQNSEVFDMWNITEFEGFYRGEKTEINYMELVKSP